MTRLLPRQWFGESQGFLAGTFSLSNGKDGCFTPYPRGERMKGMVSLPWANCFEGSALTFSCSLHQQCPLSLVLCSFRLPAIQFFLPRKSSGRSGV